MDEKQAQYRVIVGLGSCGIAAGAKAVYERLSQKIHEHGLENKVQLDITSCIGMCFCEPLVDVLDTKGNRTTYGNVDARLVDRLVDEHLTCDRPAMDATINLGQLQTATARFLSPQKKIVLRNCGLINPESIEDYLQAGGYRALSAVLDRPAADVIKTIKESGLRGRGGGGFSTGIKWQLAADATGQKKYVICNADEGDPGAFMDRSTLEGDPHSVLEGMMICGYAIGASEGYIYCRAEYPLAVHRLQLAIEQAEKKGFLGENVLGRGFSFRIRVKEGAGAFVCGEETALIGSIEGKRGMPKRRPPYPAASGLFGYPTNINNVETFANVPWIIAHGAKAFSSIGTEKSKGTKVFALAGKIKNGGLVEVPMGITIREIVEEIGGGSSTGKPLKAVQLGGPSGGCIPASLFETRVDYDEVVRTGAIMGSGGMLVMDETTCMVDVARFFLQFTQSESCGKCTFCRIGTKRMLETLNRIAQGKGEAKDLALIEELSPEIIKGSLCGLGQTAPNPVLTTLRYFRDEYIEHIEHKKCRAGVCKDLITYSITGACVGCTACSKLCPTQAITGERKKPHTIDSNKCVKCGRCRLQCRFQAIEVQ